MDDPRKYMRIAAEIRDQIMAGTLPPGCEVPAVTGLAEDHGATRITVGKALRMLEDEGLVWRVPGLGYYVTSQQEASASGRTWRCLCGSQFDDVPALEDHLFVFPEEDEHYELADEGPGPDRAGS